MVELKEEWSVVQRSRRVRRDGWLAVIALLLVSSSIHAEEKPAALVQYRQNVMKSLASHMNALNGLVSGDVELPDQAVIHASSVSALLHVLPTLFPQDTGPERVKTGAKAEVWKRSAAFRAAEERADAEAAKLLGVARSGDRVALRSEVAAVSKACAACHRDYRLKDW